MAQEEGFHITEFVPTGGLDMDSVPLAVAKNDWTFALNVSTINTNQQSTGSVFQLNGNTLSVNMPVVTTQNKIYSLTISEDNQPKNYVIDFLNLNYSQFAQASVTTTGNISTDATTFATNISSAFSSLFVQVTVSYTISGNIATFLITVKHPSILGLEYLIVDDSTATALTNPIVTQEAIDASITAWDGGNCLPIGGLDYLGDLFIWSTCQGNSPQAFNILSVENSLSGFFNVNVAGNQTATGTGFIETGFLISIQGVQGATTMNGIWLIGAASYNSISAGNTTFTLTNCTYTSGYVANTGTATTFFQGYEAITVNQKNNDTGNWTTYELLGTKAINGRFYNPIRKEIVANKNNNILALYWVDGNDYDRIFQYTGAYMNNGGIKYYNPLGLYTYEGIGISSREMKNTTTSVVTVSNVINGGGGIYSGDWSYTVQPLDSNLTSGAVSVLTQPVNIYNGSWSEPYNIVGTVGQKSAMQVTIKVSQIPVNVWSYFNLIGVQYVGLTETPYVIKQVPVPPDATEITIVHTGLETYIPYTDGFLLPSQVYISSGTQTVSSNTLLKADLTAELIPDLSAFSQLWTHVMQRNTTVLQPLGDDSGGTSTFTLGEYQIPTATCNNVSGMLNETYRTLLVYELISGGFTPPYWCDDIRFDTYVTNRANPFGINRRTANNIPNYDLSESPASINPSAINSYVFYLTLSPPVGYQNYLINGVPLNQIVKRVYVYRVDNNVDQLNEAVCCGLTVRNVAKGLPLATGYPNGGASNYLFENPLLVNTYGSVAASLPAPNMPTNTETYLFGGSSTWKYGVWGGSIPSDLITSTSANGGSFYSPDLIYGQTLLSFSSNDSVLCYGQPAWTVGGTGNMDSFSTNVASASGSEVNTEIRLSGSTSVTSDPYSTPAINLPLQAATNISLYSEVNYSILSGSVFYCPAFAIATSPTAPAVVTPNHIWLYTSTNFTCTSTNTSTDIGLYYCQYYSDLGSATASANAANYPNNTKFGAINTRQGIPTGAILDVSANQASVDVYGWDAFNQKSFVRLQVGYGTGGGAVGAATAVFICQNRINYNMRDEGSLGYPNPTPQANWINDDSAAIPSNTYDEGYTPRNPDDTLNVYNPSLPVVTSFPERIIFSLVQPNGSTSNNWQIFPPLNFYDLSSDKGIITNLTTLQGELYTIQQLSVQKQNYNQRGTMNVNEASTTEQILIGSGTPFDVPGFPITTNIGSSNNHALLYGTGIHGESIRAFVDITHQQIVIFSKNGFEIVSLTKKMRSFFQNNLSLVNGDYPYNNGITGVFDEKRKQFIWTVRAYNTSPALQPYNSGTTYGETIIISYGLTFEGLPQFYKSLQNNNTGNTPSSSPTWWYPIPYNNEGSGLSVPLYNVYTIIYSIIPKINEKGELEDNSRFITFLSAIPYFYVEWEKTFLTGFPQIAEGNSLWEDDLGVTGSYYGNSYNGLITYPVNDFNNASKMFVGQYYSSNLIPYYLNYQTNLCASYTPQSQEDWINLNNDEYYNMIFNDTITAPNSTPYEDTTSLYGSWLLTTVTFPSFSLQSVGQVIYKIVTKFKALSRTSEK